MYASIDDVEARLGRELSAAERLEVQAFLLEASALVDGYLGVAEPLDPVPDVVAAVVVKLVVRALTADAGSPENVSTLQQSAGPYARTFTFAGEGASLWLGAAEKLMLRPWYRGVVSVPLVSDRGQHG